MAFILKEYDRNASAFFPLQLDTLAVQQRLQGARNHDRERITGPLNRPHGGFSSKGFNWEATRVNHLLCKKCFAPVGDVNPPPPPPNRGMYRFIMSNHLVSSFILRIFIFILLSVYSKINYYTNKWTSNGFLNVAYWLLIVLEERITSFMCVCVLLLPHRPRLRGETHQSVMVMGDDGRPRSQSEPYTLSALGGPERLVPRVTSGAPLRPPGRLPAAQPELSL